VWRNRLNDAVRAKLRLASRGDIKRWGDSMRTERLELEEVRQSLGTGEAATVRLRRSFEQTPDTFGDDSLFAKTLRKILREKAEPKGR
jgi:hypothetical protein